MSSTLMEGDTSDREETTSLTTDEIFHVLQNERRRNVLQYLQGRTEPVRMRDVAEQVAAWEHETTVQQLSSKQRQRVYIPLYQSHLPKLDELGIIEYQQNRGIVERLPLADRFDPYLRAHQGESSPALAQDGDHPDQYYLGVTALGGVLLLGALLELPIFSTLSGIAVVVLILVLLTVPTVMRLRETTDIAEFTTTAA